MGLRVFQKGFNYSQDGAGNRLVYHLQGCNLHCPWCSNPEGMDFENPSSFIMTAEEIITEALRSRAMFFDGGGVTFTGGEASCQFEALKETLQALKKEGVNTVLETNGTNRRLPEIFHFIDGLIMDFKHYDPEIHEAVTGMQNGVIKENIISAFNSHPDLLVRIPLIGNFNASPEDIKRFTEFFNRYPHDNARFELLLYHEYGRDKWLECGKEYTVRDAFVSEEKRVEYEEFMKKSGLNIIRT